MCVCVCVCVRGGANAKENEGKGERDQRSALFVALLFSFVLSESGKSEQPQCEVLWQTPLSEYRDRER